MFLKNIFTIEMIFGFIVFFIVLNILLIQFPLTSTFGYEFAAVNGLLFVVIAGLQIIRLAFKSEFNISKLIKILLFFS